MGKYIARPPWERGAAKASFKPTCEWQRWEVEA